MASIPIFCNLITNKLKCLFVLFNKFSFFKTDEHQQKAKKQALFASDKFKQQLIKSKWKIPKLK